MSDHQPSNPKDLERFPARTPECVRVRGMLRDFADGDGAASESSPNASAGGEPWRHEVEVHVHGCRDCSLALSRAEHEVWVLRQALRAPGTRLSNAMRPESGFASRAVARAMGELASELDAADAAFDGRGTLQGDGEGRSGMARSRPDGSAAGRSRWSALYLGVPLAALAVLGVSLAILWGLRDDRDNQVAAPEAFVPHVVDARHASWWGGDRVRRNAPFHDGDLLDVGDQGRARIRIAPGAHFDVWEQSALRRGDDGAWALDRGGLEAELDQELEVAVVDGSKITMSPGRYLVVAEEVDRFDQALDPMGSWRFRVAVQFGSAVVRDGEDEILEIGEGEAGVFLTGDGWAAEPLLSDSVLASSLAPTTGVAGDVPLYLSRVLDQRTNQPLVGAAVQVTTPRGDTVGWTDEFGRVQIQDIDAMNALAESGEGGTIVILVRPAPQAEFAGDPEHPSLVLPYPRRMHREPVVQSIGGAGEGRFLCDPIRVPPSRVVRGRVTASDGALLSGAAVLPAIRDELFGTLHRLREFDAVVTNANGEFDVLGLPSAGVPGGLGPLQSLVLLVGTGGAGVAVVPVDADPGKGAASRLDVALPQVREIVLESPFPAGSPAAVAMPGARWEIAEVSPGCGGEIVLIRTVRADGAGVLRCQWNGGEVWARIANRSGAFGPNHAGTSGAWTAWRALRVARNTKTATTHELGDELVLGSATLRGLVAPRGPAALGERVERLQHHAARLQWVPGLRYERVALASPDASSVTVTESGFPQSAELFTRDANGLVSYVGAYDGLVGCPVDLPEGGSLWALAHPAHLGGAPHSNPLGAVGGEAVLGPVGRAIVELTGLASFDVPPDLGELAGVVQLSGPLGSVLRTVEAGGRWEIDPVFPGPWTVRLPSGRSVDLQLLPGHTSSVR